MNQTAIKELQFREMRGDYSTRISANGDAPFELLAKDPTLYEGFLNNTDKIYREICRMKELPSMTAEEKRVFENHVRIYGDRQKILRESSQCAFERVFISVSQALLPAAFFLHIVTEARGIWRQQGFASGHLIDMKKARKHARKEKTHNYFRKLNNVKRSKAIIVHEEDFQI